MTNVKRRRPIGAEPTDAGVDFRVWAPDHRDVAVVIDDRDHPLERDGDGYFRGEVRGARAGTRYRFRLDRARETFPDPASRFQPEGPHGPSEVVDPIAYRWREGNPRIDRRVIYEMHIGTFTREGTWRAAVEHLAPLAEIGINTLEVMPVHDFAGRFGWGYDGVDLWAPTHLYGSPDNFRAFIDAAHSHGLAVILDVVYNHFGPDGSYVRQFTKSYFADRQNEWGQAINFDGAGCEGVREFFSENAGYWIDEFHLDGLRLDATQSINDSSPEHIVAVIARRARDAAPDREIFVVAENEPQDIALITKLGVDAMWNDDWHHAAMIVAGKPREAYYTDYKGTPQEFVSLARHGFLYQGQWYAWQKKRRGRTSLDTPPERLVCYVQNHDQVANSQDGRRLHQITTPGKYRALTALLLLGPNTPMLFQGEEFASDAPFLYFADHNPELAKAVAKGRGEFLEQFPSIDRKRVDLPHDLKTFDKCKLEHRAPVPLIRDLLRLRRDISGDVDGAVLGDVAFLLRYSDGHLLIVNLGPHLDLDVAPEPLLAPPPNARWNVIWSTDGTKQIEFEAVPSWRIPAECAILLRGVTASS